MTWEAHRSGLAGLVRGVRAEHPGWNPAKVAHHLGTDRRAVEAVWGGDRDLDEYRRHRWERR